MSEHLRAAVIVMLTIVVVFAAILFAAWMLRDEDPQMQLPLLVIGGLVALLGMLAVMAVAFKTVDLADPKQALGLPDGTVRAVIALSLILIFAVVTVYLFSSLSNDTDEAAAATVADLQRQILRVSAVSSAPPPSAPATTTTTTTPPAPTSPVTPSTPVATHAAAHDFAKQLLIMLGTLITSITSFYFASKSVSDAAAVAPKAAPPTPPNVTDVNPREVPRDAGGRAEIGLRGTNLLTVNTALLRKPGYEIAAYDILSSASSARFTLPVDITSGSWDIVLKTSDGAETIVHPGIEIS